MKLSTRSALMVFVALAVPSPAVAESNNVADLSQQNVQADTNPQNEAVEHSFLRSLQSCSNCCDSNADCADNGAFYICQNPPNGNCNKLPVPEGGGGCFSKDSTVNVLGVGKVMMKDLSVGDKVFTTGEGYYEPIYGFGHLDRTTSADFLEIHVDSTGKGKQALKVTGDHLIHSGGHFVPASSIQVGELLAKDVIVTKIRSTKDIGLYAPLTASGTLVVNDIKTSTYVSLQKGHPQYLKVAGQDSVLSQHWFSHVAMSPLRALCLGVSSAFCADKLIDESGYAWYTQLGYAMTNYAERQQTSTTNAVLQSLFLFVVGLFSLIFYAFECAVGAPFVPLAMAASFAGLVYMSTNRGAPTKAAS